MAAANSTTGSRAAVTYHQSGDSEFDPAGRHEHRGGAAHHAEHLQPSPLGHQHPAGQSTQPREDGQ